MAKKQLAKEEDLDLENYRTVYRKFRMETANQTITGGNEELTKLEESMKLETIVRERQLISKEMEISHQIEKLEKSIVHLESPKKPTFFEKLFGTSLDEEDEEIIR